MIFRFLRPPDIDLKESIGLRLTYHGAHLPVVFIPGCGQVFDWRDFSASLVAFIRVGENLDGNLQEA